MWESQRLVFISTLMVLTDEFISMSKVKYN